MKKIKTILGALLVWQATALFYKDKSFKDKFKDAKWMDKFTVLFDSMFDLNKKLFKDIKEFDYSGEYEKLKSVIFEEKEVVEQKIDTLRNKWDDLNEDKIRPMIKEIEEHTKNLSNMIEEKYTELKDKYDDIKDKHEFDEIVDNIKAKTKELKDKLKMKK